MKKINKTIVIASVFILIILIWILAVIRVNVVTEKTEYKYYDCGDKFEYMGLDFEITGSEYYMSRNEFENKNNIQIDSGLDQSEDCVVCLVWMNVKKNKTSDEISVYDVISNTKLDNKVTELCIYNQYIDANRKVIDSSDESEMGQTMKIGVIYIQWKCNINSFYEKKLNTYQLYVQFPDYEGSRYYRRVRLN